MNLNYMTPFSNKRDRREVYFFAAVIIAVLLKFYFLEIIISKLPTRYPASAAASVGIVLWIILPVSLLWRKARPAAALLLDFLLTALVVTDLLYMRYYSDLFSFLNIGLSTQVSDISDSVFALFRASDLLFIADFPLFAGWLTLSHRKHPDVPIFKKITVKRVEYVVLFLLIGFCGIFWRVYSYQQRMPNVLRSMWDRPAVSNNVGVLTYHLADAWNIARDAAMKGIVPPEELDAVADWYGSRSKTPRRGPLFASQKGKNLIIIQVESLQQFVVGMKVNGKEITPNINEFVKSSHYFTRAYNQTASGNSSDAEFLSNTGLYPSPSGVAFTRFAKNTYDAMPGILAKNGYSTLALHGDRPGFWNRVHMYPALGFQRFVSKQDFVMEEKVGMGLSDKSFFKQSLKVLKKEKRPFYAFLITLSSHYPFNFPELVVQTGFDAGKFKGKFIGDYVASMHYFDTQFGKFVKGLKKAGLLDSSIVIVYGDHTAIPDWDREELEWLLGRSLKEDWKWREVQKVPLIIRIPGNGRAVRDDKTATGLLDVPETAMSLLGFDFPRGFGRDLFDPKAAEPVVFRNGSYITGNAFIEPSTGAASDVHSGKKLDFASFGSVTRQAADRLRFSDWVLLHDLIPVLDKRKGLE